ncbi:hypothetical protein KFL_000910050 [Klebsormidium nitens]|uniref:Uncharacterized protein n=1 Tax=Klebsormidium nitens TaxID=105231 RepID=A0A1Y1HT41_KLENI|nr:hypothetical protein KFL_000910050 [Klebsormidium nitens]|eukprot:GAQ81784.1 hypothetical protein KFL_000910050 [Klebsormidium nitens]
MALISLQVTSAASGVGQELAELVEERVATPVSPRRWQQGRAPRLLWCVLMEFKSDRHRPSGTSLLDVSESRGTSPCAQVA